MQKKLLADNISVLGLSRSRGFMDGHVDDKYCCDILDKDRLMNILNQYKPDYIVHMASPAFIPDSYNEPQKTYSAISQGTLNILTCVRELNLSSRLLYISSADVFGRGAISLLTESCAYDPNNPYASAKACSELICKQFASSYEMDIIIARPFNHTGPGQSPNFVCSGLAYQVAAMAGVGKQRLYTGNIDIKRDFLDVRDVVDAYACLLHQGVSREVYNICSGDAKLIRDIINELFRLAEIDHYEIVVDPGKVRTNDIPIRVGDNRKIKQLTGWVPKYPLEQTMRDLLFYWKENLHASK